MGGGRHDQPAAKSQSQRAVPSRLGQPKKKKLKVTPLAAALPGAELQSRHRKRKTTQGKEQAVRGSTGKGRGGSVDEIDAIFAAATSQAASAPSAAKAQGQKQKGSPPPPKIVGSKHDLFGEAGASRKRTEEGWSIYTEEELGLSKQGGETDLCPFDCQCCF